MNSTEVAYLASNIDPWSIVAIIALIALIIVGVEKVTDAGSKLKKRFLDRKFDKMIEHAEKGDMSLREELENSYIKTEEDHKEFRVRLDQHETYLDNDKRQFERVDRILDRHEAEIESLKGEMVNVHHRLDARTEEGTMTIKAIKAILNEKLGIGQVSDMTEVVNEIDEYLIEGREK